MKGSLARRRALPAQFIASRIEVDKPWSVTSAAVTPVRRLAAGLHTGHDQLTSPEMGRTGKDGEGRGGRGTTMSTGASERNAGEPGPAEVDTGAAAPLAPDRPYVDGTTASPEELRAEVERLRDEDRQHVDDLREEVGDSLAALASKFDVKARVAERKDEAVAAGRRHVDHARHVAADRAVVAKNSAAEKPGLVAGIAAALVVLLVVVLRRRRRR
jgi:hypothetical protein